MDRRCSALDCQACTGCGNCQVCFQEGCDCGEISQFTEADWQALSPADRARLEELRHLVDWARAVTQAGGAS